MPASITHSAPVGGIASSPGAPRRRRCSERPRVRFRAIRHHVSDRTLLMDGEPRDLEQRVSTLESELARMREQMSATTQQAADAAVDAAAARTLAAGADHDVS